MNEQKIKNLIPKVQKAKENLSVFEKQFPKDKSFNEVFCVMEKYLSHQTEENYRNFRNAVKTAWKIYDHYSDEFIQGHVEGDYDDVTAYNNATNAAFSIYGVMEEIYNTNFEFEYMK